MLYKHDKTSKKLQGEESCHQRMECNRSKVALELTEGISYKLIVKNI